MVSRPLAFVVAASLAIATSTAAIAQTTGGSPSSPPAPAPGTNPAGASGTDIRTSHSDLFLMLGAIAAAALIAALASQIGSKKPASP